MREDENCQNKQLTIRVMFTMDNFLQKCSNFTQHFQFCLLFILKCFFPSQYIQYGRELLRVTI